MKRDIWKKTHIVDNYFVGVTKEQNYKQCYTWLQIKIN